MSHTSAVRLLGAAVLALLSAAASAQPPAGGWGGDSGDREKIAERKREGMARELGLSGPQQAKLREIMDAQRPQREAVRQKIDANREALHQLLESGSADASAVGELVLEGRRLHEESRALREAEQKAIRDSLTPEQQKKFDSMLQRRRDPRRPGEGDWPGGLRPGAPGRPVGPDGPRGPGGTGGPGGPRAPFGPDEAGSRSWR